MELSQEEIKELKNLITKYKNPEETIEDRFWTNTLKGDPNECWNWIGDKDAEGYGRLGVQGKTKLAHRISWELRYNQKVPEDLLILHHCDNPSCVNPNHLYCGTQQDNINDMIDRKRKPTKKDPFANADLSAIIILQIRYYKNCDLEAGDKVAIARKFRVTAATIDNIWKADVYPCKEQLFIKFND